jgi:aspartokinase
MGVFEMVVVIVIVSCIAGVTNRYLKMKHAQTDRYSPDEETTDRLSELENRIQVLEKIVTDNKYNLEQEIDQL